MTTTKCTGIVGRLFGHNFEARYSYGAATTMVDEFEGNASAVIAVIEASKPETYVHDVCTRCGATIEKKP